MAVPGRKSFRYIYTYTYVHIYMYLYTYTYIHILIHTWPLAKTPLSDSDLFKPVLRPKWNPKDTTKRLQKGPKLCQFVLKPGPNDPENILSNECIGLKEIATDTNKIPKRNPNSAKDAPWSLPRLSADSPQTLHGLPRPLTPTGGKHDLQKSSFYRGNRSTRVASAL